MRFYGINIKENLLRENEVFLPNVYVSTSKNIIVSNLISPYLKIYDINNPDNKITTYYNILYIDNINIKINGNNIIIKFSCYQKNNEHIIHNIFSIVNDNIDTSNYDNFWNSILESIRNNLHLEYMDT